MTYIEGSLRQAFPRVVITDNIYFENVFFLSFLSVELHSMDSLLTKSFLGIAYRSFGIGNYSVD